MARNTTAVYSGTLKLDKVTGIRHDKGQKISYVPVKKENALKESKKSMKTTPNVTRDGLKK